MKLFVWSLSRGSEPAFPGGKPGQAMNRARADEGVFAAERSRELGKVVNLVEYRAEVEFCLVPDVAE